jgi:magnesium chelatase subunit I
VSTPAIPANLPGTVGELRAAGYTARGIKTELRENLLAILSEGGNPWPGIVGFDRTVLPQLERALLAGHDFVLLGERGQGKTRLARTLIGLLDEWTPVITGAELGEHPLDPISPASRRRAAELGDDLPVAWRHRSERYTEKLATPDTSVGDLIGDVDPVKVAEGRSLGDPETIHFGLVPRAHRGIVAINELPDLAERIQVALLNVMEERDIQIRGYGEPGGLHQPWPDHHPAQGPLRCGDPHPLPADRRGRDRSGPPGGRPGRRGRPGPAGGHRAFRAPPA